MYKTILAPLDDSPTARHGFDEALALAHRLGSRLRVLHVVDARLLIGHVSENVSPQQLLEGWRASGERMLAAALDSARKIGVAADGVVRCDPHLRVCDAIVQEARDSGAELIVMGTHGRRGLRRMALGSDAELVVRDSHVPVLLVRGQETDGA